jgi:hypothetical protein
VGDDNNSYGFDGCRKYFWKNGPSGKLDLGQSWKSGDIVGVELDMSNYQVRFELNGVFVGSLDIEKKLYDYYNALCPTISLTGLQHVRFNFGHMPFR